MKGSVSRIVFGVLSCILMAMLGPVSAAIQGPGWFDVSTEPVDLDRARAYYQSRQAMNTGSRAASRPATESQSLIAAPQAAGASPFTDDIQSLARSLRHDPIKIYEFVRNHVQYAPYFGYLKGPGLTLLERSGNDFDQAALMIELLRASGHTANFVYGRMTIPNFWAVDQRDMQHWLGVGGIYPSVIASILASGGIPATLLARAPCCRSSPWKLPKRSPRKR